MTSEVNTPLLFSAPLPSIASNLTRGTENVSPAQESHTRLKVAGLGYLSFLMDIERETSLPKEELHTKLAELICHVANGDPEAVVAAHEAFIQDTLPTLTFPAADTH